MWVVALLLLLLGVSSGSRQLLQPAHQPQSIPLVWPQTQGTRIKLEAAIELRLDVVAVHGQSQRVTVQWDNVPGPQWDDWIAVFVPGGDLAGRGPVKFKYATAAGPSHIKSGSGQLRFQLYAYRVDSVQIAFMRNGLTNPTVAALSTPVRISNPNTPFAPRLALTGNQGSTRNSSGPTVRWQRINRDGVASGPEQTAPAYTSFTYTRDQMCGGMAAGAGWSDPGLQHVAHMTGLEPGAWYSYRVGDEAWGWSDPATFRAAPAVGSGFTDLPVLPWPPPSIVLTNKHRVHGKGTEALGSSSSSGNPDSNQASSARLLVEGGAGQHHHGGKQHHSIHSQSSTGTSGSSTSSNSRVALSGPTVRMLLAADMGQAEEDGSFQIMEAMKESLNTTRGMAADLKTGGYSLVLHAGDLSYSRGFIALWDSFLRQISPISSHVPYMVLPGNHEWDWPGSGDRFDEVLDSGGECGVAYANSFPMPVKDPQQPWYSFDYGLVHVLTYSTEHATAPGSPQHTWIAADLAAVNRSLTPWVIVAGHRPIYISSTGFLPPDGDKVVAAQLRADLEPLLLAHKVDITIHGHHHTYQRTCPVAAGKCISNDAQGVAQAPVHLVIGHAGAGLSFNIQHPEPEYLERCAVWWGYARLEASASHMNIDVVSDLDGGLMDSIQLIKPPQQ